MSNLIGVMQGRLVPKYQGRYQAHPVNYWQGEFEVAKELGVDCIEFILDFNDAEKNPLLKDGGAEEILSISEKTGVISKTICADYFMEAPLHSPDKAVAEKSLAVLKKLLVVSKCLGVEDIVVPCVDKSSLSAPDADRRFVNQVRHILDEVEGQGINLCLETDLGPNEFSVLLGNLGSKHVTVNYDIGNSAALGFDPQEELDAYGDKITDIHIKDRVLNGGPVILGHGDADFNRFFSRLKKVNYKGPFIMQAFRDDEGVAIFKKQLEWVKPFLRDI